MKNNKLCQMTFWGHNVQKCAGSCMCSVMEQRCSAYIENPHVALVSLACRPGLLQNRFHLHHCFEHHRLVFHVDFSVLPVERHKPAHIWTAAAAAASTPPCDSLINLSVFAGAQLVFFSPSLFVSRSQFVSTPSSRLIFRPLHPLTSIIPPPCSLFFYIFSLVLCPSVLVIECRSLMILMKSGGRWVINHLQMSACLRSCFRVCVLIQDFKSSYSCVAPAPYLHVINMQVAAD